MKTLPYLSPSSLGLWESDKEGFYLKHLAEARPPRIPQIDYMAVGSAFDAYVKSALYEDLFGKGTNLQFEFDAIFTEQVESHNRDFALDAGKYIMDSYTNSQAYCDLLTALQKSKFEPQFEFRLDKTVHGVPLMGKPDCRFIHEFGAHVILDWKVNGFCSKYGSTPYKYYALIRDGWKPLEASPSRKCGQPHKGYKEIIHKDVAIGAHFMEETNKDWADQLSIYSWMLDEPVGGEDVIFCIDQVACKRRENKFPLLRIANHRARISKKWQQILLQRLTACWQTINSDHVFRDVSKEESIERQEILELEAKAMRENCGNDGVEAWVIQNSRNTMKFRVRP